MGYNALITLDLPGSSEQNRKIFHEFLNAKHWSKINGSDAWVASFDIEVERDFAMNLLIKHLKEAKRISTVKKVKFALHAGKEEVKVESL